MILRALPLHVVLDEARPDRRRLAHNNIAKKDILLHTSHSSMPTIRLSRMDLKLAHIGVGMAAAEMYIHAEGRVCEYYVMTVETS